ncbi:hypothetical protein QP162_22075 [Sphingomonas aurantiaca]
MIVIGFPLVLEAGRWLALFPRLIDGYTGPVQSPISLTKGKYYGEVTGR